MATSVHPAQDTIAAPVGQVRLRRAVYVHVSDLTSAYDIDHRKLEEELTRVRSASSSDEPAAAAPTTTEDIDTSSYPQKRLQPPRGGYNLCVLVGKVNVVVDKRRVDGSRVRLAEVEVGDETGVVSLRARDNQIDVLQEVSAREGAVVLRNCMLELYQGKHIRLAVTKWGKLNTYPDQVASTPPPPSKRNQERNFSLIDLSLVASETPAAFHSNKEDAARSNPAKPSSQGQPPRGGGGQQPHQQAYQIHHHQQQQHVHAPQGGKRGGGRGMGAGGNNPGPGRQQRNPRNHPQQQKQQQQQHAPPAAGMHYGDRYQMGWHEPSMEPYGYHNPDSATMSTAAAHQQMLLRQQYELQQRQIQQMFHEQRQQMAAAAAPSDQQHQQLHHHVSRSGSFGADQTQAQQQPMLIGPASPLLMPMSALASVPPLSMHPQYQQQQQQQQGTPDRSQQQQLHHMGMGGADSPGKMNPQAATFAPSYVPAYPSLSQTPTNLASHGSLPMTYAAAAYDPSALDQGQRYHAGVASAPTSGGFHAGMMMNNPQQQQRQVQQQPQVQQGHRHHHQRPASSRDHQQR